MALQDRVDPITLYGPSGSAGTLWDTVNLGVDRLKFPVEIHEVEPGEGMQADGYRIEAFGVSHGTRAVGWALVEEDRLGRFDVERARALGVPHGPMFGQLHRGQDVEVDGSVIRSSDLVGEPRPGRTVVYTGDTRPTDEVVERAQGADLLIHEATFGGEEETRARETFHSTAAGAADVALPHPSLRPVLRRLQSAPRRCCCPLSRGSGGLRRARPRNARPLRRRSARCDGGDVRHANGIHAG